MKIFVIRHGGTDWNIKHMNYKSLNNKDKINVIDDDFISINSTGIEQANQLFKK